MYRSRDPIIICLVLLIATTIFGVSGCITGPRWIKSTPHPPQTNLAGAQSEPWDSGSPVERKVISDPETTAELIDAAIEGDIYMVQAALEAGADPDLVPHGYDFPTISEAAANGHGDVLLLLLSSGADPDIQGINNVTALMIAAQNGNTGMVENLLEYGADPGLTNNYGTTALISAALGGYAEIASRILLALDDPEGHDFEGQRSLMVLVWPSWVLQEFGYSVDLYTNRDEVSMMLTGVISPNERHIYSDNQLDAIGILLAAGVNVNNISSGDTSVIYMAVREECPELVKVLVEHGADPNLGNSAFRVCIETENDICFAMLTGSEYSIGERRSDSFTGTKYVEILEILLESGARPEYLWSDYGDLMHPVVSTARYGNREMLELLIEYGIDSNDPWLEQSLMKAVYFNFPEIAELLLEQGADPGMLLDEWPYTSLLTAIRLGFERGGTHTEGGNTQEQMVRVLLDAGADPNVVPEYGSTALAMSSRLGTPGVVSALLDAGADAEIQDPNGFTALMMACGYGRSDLIEAFVNGGADISMQGSTGFTALMCTAMRSHEFEDRTITSIYRNPEMEMGFGPAPESGRNECARILLEAGCETDTIATRYDEACMLEGPTALWYAVDTSNVELVRLLLEHGANPNVGASVYSMSTSRNDTEIIEMLQDQSMVVDDETARIFLNSALQRGDLDRVLSLLENGVDPNLSLGQFNNTPLMRAASNGHYEIVLALLDYGADPNYSRDAPTMYDTETGESLYGFWTPLLFAVRGNVPEIVRAILDAGADIEIAYTLNYTPLIVAAGIGNPEIVGILLENDADVNATSYVGNTALMCAAMTYEEFLLNAFYHGKNYSGDTSELPGRDPLRVVELLLEAGCDPSLENVDGKTAYSIAVESGYEEIASLLENLAETE